MRVITDKPQGIQVDFVRNDDNWQDWTFQQLIEASEKWTVRNPIPLSDKKNPEYQAKQNKNECVYCEKPEHR